MQRSRKLCKEQTRASLPNAWAGNIWQDGWLSRDKNTVEFEVHNILWNVRKGVPQVSMSRMRSANVQVNVFRMKLDWRRFKHVLCRLMIFHVFFKISRSGITFYQTSYLLMIFQMSAFAKMSTWCCEELNSDMSTVIW